MRIFLSYATEQKGVAEPIAFSLRSRGHHVFLDKDDLPAGRTFDDQIQKAVESSDVMIFLVSPTSVAKGRYTRTELEFARAAWRHPTNRVLPVMIEPTPIEDIPAFLKGVTMLEPQGNVTAEVASALERLRGGKFAVGTIFRSALIAGGSMAAISLTAAMLTPDLSVFFLAGLPIFALMYFGLRHRTPWILAPILTVAIATAAIARLDTSGFMRTIDLGPLLDRNVIGFPSQADDPAKAEQAEAARMAELKKVSDHNSTLMTASLYAELGLRGGLLAIGTLAGAALAASMFQSFSRWLATIAIAALGSPLSFVVSEAFLDIGSPETGGIISLAVDASLLLALLGAVLGAWIAKGATT
ncbi:MAG: toll/interleukin-1 receptor domain-containing protein [Hyphomicrobium sp.]|uniref:toll/interleukin-1 receptor domain-containing protein n=1 Tax=Hyphomicrobium sp. TaxID=82 RepID=UPI003D0D3D55